MKRRSLIYTVRGGIITALYLALTLIFAPISYGAVQFRISESLSLLPMLFPESVLALFAGCLISNMMSSLGIVDMIFGSVATLAAAYLTSKIKNKYIAPIPSVLINAAVVGGMTAYMSSPSDANVFFSVFAVNFLTVGAGQAVVCYLLALPLISGFERLLPKLRNKKIL